MRLDFAVVPAFLDRLLLGAMWTLAITLAAGALSLGGGVMLAVALLYGARPLQALLRTLAWVIRGTPLLLQLFLVYFGLVQVGLDLDAFTAGVIAVGLHFAVYNADVIQAGILATDRGQGEAGRTLGLSRAQTVRSIIVPQALRAVAPPLGNNMIALLKDTALVSVIGVTELTLSSQLAIARTFRPFEFYVAAAAIYYGINLVLEAVLVVVERRLALTR